MVAPNRTLTSLVEEIRQRCDQESSTFVADTAEIAVWISQSAAALYDLILDYAGPEAFATRSTFLTVAGTDLYELPHDHYRLIGVDAMFGTKWEPLGRATIADRNRWQGEGWTSKLDTRYALFGRMTSAVFTSNQPSVQRILFVPPPRGEVSIRVWYLPLPVTVQDSTAGATPGGAYVPPTGPLVSFAGWDEWVVADVCAKILEKEEGAARPFVERRKEATMRIIAAAKQLDSAEPLRMRDALEEALADDPEPLWRD